MKRKIVKINQEKCNGCGLCINACHEQAIVLNSDGKAELIKDDYCDGLGDCLPVCPVDAISLEEREAAPYDDDAVKARIESMQCGCPGTATKSIEKISENKDFTNEKIGSNLRQWPVQIQLVPSNASYFKDANLLIAADCTAYAYGNFHNEFMKNKITLIGCPKLDTTEYSKKLTDIIRDNDIKSVTIVRMEVPCCSGIELAAKKALKDSAKFIPWHVVTISTEGEIVE